MMRTLVVGCLILKSGVVFSAKPVSLLSPDKKIRYELQIIDGYPAYRVYYENRNIIAYSALELKGNEISSDAQIEFIVRKDSAEQYQLMTGRSSAVNDSFRQLTIYFRVTNKKTSAWMLEVRAFNDGIAFRYLFPKSGSDSLLLSEEKTEFRLTGNPMVHALVLPDYHSSHEGNYLHRNYQSLPSDSLMDLPMLFSYADSLFVALTEASLLDYGGMYLKKNSRGLRADISPNLSHPGYIVASSLPHQSPWRVILISRHVGTFLETNIITSLCPPQRIKDLSWLRPGKTTFPWWNGNVTPDTLNAPGNNFVTQKYYIDFCARAGIEYHSVVEYGLHQWYQDDGVSFMPGLNSNVLKPVPGLDMKQVCDYAHSVGVGVRVWVHWKALYPKLDSAFTLFQQWGLSGLMVDFMDRDDQDMVNMQTEILEKAAVHHLHIQFHGAYKPTGLSRTYPNEFTREGALNDEYDKWDAKGVSPDHDLDIAITRGMAGSTDYHLGGFRAVTPEHFRAQYTRPLVLGTRCHMLAMYVVLENANAMVCDYPAAYEGQPGFEFIQQVPTTWDETKLLLGLPDKIIIVARKKNNVWWIGGLAGNIPRTADLDFSFLRAGNWKATVYKDDLKTPFDPNGIVIESANVNAGSRITIPLASGGGFTMKIRKE